MEVEIQGLYVERDDLRTRVEDLLTGYATLRGRIRALDKEVRKTKEKAVAYSRKVKDVNLGL